MNDENDDSDGGNKREIEGAEQCGGCMRCVNNWITISIDENNLF